MLYHLERFLKPFRLLMAFHVIEMDVSGYKLPFKSPSTTTSTTAATTSTTTTPATAASSTDPGLASAATTSAEPSTVGVTAMTTTYSASHAPLSSGKGSQVRVSWVYNLSKTQVQQELSRYGAPTHGTANQLRADLVRILRQGGAGAGLDDPEESENDEVEESTDGGVLPFELESASVREMLGLLPTADFQEVKRLLTSTVDMKPASQVPPKTYERSDGLPTFDVYLQRPISANLFSGGQRKPDIPATEFADLSQYRVSEREYAAQQYDSERISRLARFSEGGHRDSRGKNNFAEIEQATERVSNTASLCNMVRKWSLRFDGKRDADAISFMERLHELMESYEVPQEMMIKALPELLKDSALLWCRNNRDFWTSFGDFLRDFQAQYLPSGYLLHLDDEIRKRTQGEGEVFRQYVVAISTLIRRRGGFSESEKIDRIYANMHPNYKTYIRRRDFVNLNSLMKVAEEYEAYLRERMNYRPPPGPGQALVPETAFHGRSRPSAKALYYSSVLSTPEGELDFETSRGEYNRRPPRVTFGDRLAHRDKEDPTVTSPAEHEQPQRPRPNHTTWVSDRGQPGRPCPKHGNRTSNRGQPQWPRPDQASREDRAPPKICWNCDRVGHLYRECRKPRVLKCFNCKKPGVRTTECGCLKSENQAGTTEQGGRRSPSPAPPQGPPTSS